MGLINTLDATNDAVKLKKYFSTSIMTEINAVKISLIQFNVLKSNDSNESNDATPAVCTR